MAAQSALFVLLFGLAVLVAVAIPVTQWTHSRLTGWNALAQRYRWDGTWEGEKWSFCTVGTRLGALRNQFTVGADHRWLYLRSVAPLGSARHVPLRIPWSEVREHSESDGSTRLTFLEVPGVYLRVGGALSRKVETATGVPAPLRAAAPGGRA